MKKTAIALAAMIAASGSALAADFTVYGKVDVGFGYSNVDSFSNSTPAGKLGPVDGGTKETFSLDSGNNSGSRFGFKGTEDLGNGYAVSFLLENGFDADTGSLGYDDRLFGREARLSLETPYGTASFGRMGSLTSGAGTYDLFQLYGDNHDGGWGYNLGVGNWADRGRYDNMVTYASPKFAGLQGFAQYSFGTDAKGDTKYDDDVSNGRDTQRYYALGVTYDNGPLNAGLFFDSILRKDIKGSERMLQTEDDAYSISLALAYDLEVVKLTFGAQYGWNESINFFTDDLTNLNVEGGNFSHHFSDFVADSYRLHLGATVPLTCGTFKAGLYYGDVETKYSNEQLTLGTDTFTNVDGKNLNLVLTHEYPWSKRTYSYVGLGVKHVTLENKEGQTLQEENSFSAMLGLVHSF